MRRGITALSQPTNLTANITGLGVTISSGISANNKVYDGTTVAGLTTNNVVLSGVLAGDAANVVLTTNGYVANFTSVNVSNNVPVTVSGLSLAGSASGNYVLSQPTNLTANITPKVLTIVAVPPPVITINRCDQRHCYHYMDCGYERNLQSAVHQQSGQRHLELTCHRM